MKYVFNKGDLIEFEDGEYSDHVVWMPMRVLKKFNIREEADKFVKDNQEMMEEYSFSFDKLVAHLVSSGFVEEQSEELVYRVWLGAYSTLRDISQLGAY